MVNKDKQNVGKHTFRLLLEHEHQLLGLHSKQIWRAKTKKYTLEQIQNRQKK